MASRYVVGEEGSQCLEEDVSSEPRTENVARDEAQLELHRVVFHGDLASAKAALERGASVSVQDRFGNTPLHIAVMLGHKELVECLLSRGAVVKDKNNCGWTPLDEAISYGDKNTSWSLSLPLCLNVPCVTCGAIEQPSYFLTTTQTHSVSRYRITE
jgi:ankyrin repeat protein